MAYCTAADVKVYVGAVVSDADLGFMIADSDSEIGAFFLARGGITPSSAVAKQVSILLTRAKVAERFQLTGENPAGYSSGDYSQSGSADQLGQSKLLLERANKIMNDEIGDCRQIIRILRVSEEAMLWLTISNSTSRISRNRSRS